MTNNYIVPTIFEKTTKGEKAYDIYSRLLIDRIIFLTGEINDEMANAICAQLLFLYCQDSKKQISIYINSPGGVVTAGLAIYDVMNYVSCPIATYCLGQAASMAAVLLSAGDKGLRNSLPNARIMIHQPSGGTQGRMSDIEISYKEGQRLKDKLNEILAKNTGKTIKEIEDATDRDNFMTSEAAVKFGIIDKVI